MENKLNVYQRLLEVRKSVSYLKKDADNKGQGFKFVSSSQTLAAVRSAMNEQGLMLIPKVKDYEVRNHSTSSGANWYFTILKMEFEWINSDYPEDCFTCKWTGQGLDNGEKGVGKALTYAEKYFILKTFNIPTDKDDPDAFEQKHDKNGKSKKTTAKKQTDKPDATADREEKVKFIDKIMANAIKLTEYEAPENATKDEKNKLCGEILTQLTTYEFEDDEGNKKSLPTADTRNKLFKFSVKRLQAIYGTSKKELEGMGNIPESNNPALF